MGKAGLAVLCKHDVAVVSLVGKVTAWHVLFLSFLMDSVFIFWLSSQIWKCLSLFLDCAKLG